MPTISIEKLFGGFAPGTNSAALEGAENQYTHQGTITIDREGYFGHIAPGYPLVAVSSSTQVNSLPMNAAANTGGKFFAILNGIAASVSAGVVPFTGTSISTRHDVSASSLTRGEDAIGFVSANGTEFSFYSWYTSGSGDIGRISAVTGSPTYDDNYWNTTAATRVGGSALTPSVPLKLAVGPDGIVYCTNGQYIASFDPTTDTVNYQALDVKPGYLLTSITTWGNYVVVSGYRRTTSQTQGGNASTHSESAVFFWDGWSPTFNFFYPLNDYYAGAVFNDGENLYAFTYGRNNKTKVKVFNGNGFVPIEERRPGDVGYAPNHGQVDSVKRFLVWADSGTTGNILALGSPDPHITERGLHLIAGGQTLGMLKSLDGAVYVGNNNSGTYTINKIDQDKYATSPVWLSRLIVLPYKAVIRRIKVYFSQFGSGASVTVSLFKDYVTTGIGGANDLVNTTLTNATLGTVYSQHIDKRIPDVNAFYLAVTFNHASETSTAAIIRKIEVDYEPVNKP